MNRNGRPGTRGDTSVRGNKASRGLKIGSAVCLGGTLYRKRRDDGLRGTLLNSASGLWDAVLQTIPARAYFAHTAHPPYVWYIGAKSSLAVLVLPKLASFKTFADLKMFYVCSVGLFEYDIWSGLLRKCNYVERRPDVSKDSFGTPKYHCMVTVSKGRFGKKRR
jgi:hypothetical protein